MRNLLRQKFIKAFTLLAITNAVFVGGVAHAYDYKWDWWVTSNHTGTTPTVIKTSQYWQFTLTSTTNGGVTLGMPYFVYPFPPHSISPWTVRYEVTSIGGSGTCIMRPTWQSTNALTGANTINLAVTGVVSTTTSFTSPTSNQGQFGISVYRNTGTCAVTIRIYEVLANDGTVLWNPQSNLTNVTLNVTTATSGSPIPTDFNVSLQNDQLWNFILLFALFAGTLLLMIHLMRPLYVRK